MPYVYLRIPFTYTYVYIYYTMNKVMHYYYYYYNTDLLRLYIVYITSICSILYDGPTSIPPIMNII